MKHKYFKQLQNLVMTMHILCQFLCVSIATNLTRLVQFILLPK